jgi:hypothetical protein
VFALWRALASPSAIMIVTVAEALLIFSPSDLQETIVHPEIRH